jgi:hypothetical protein
MAAALAKIVRALLSLGFGRRLKDKMRLQDERDRGHVGDHRRFDEIGD